MFLVAKSGGNIAATYLPIAQTCPSTCPHRDNGCYAQSGNVAFHNRRLERANEHRSSYDVIRAEAREITKAGPTAAGKALRLHVSGDVRSNAAAKLLAKAAKKWDGRVYTYTHSWRQIERSSWGSISVLASCETPAQVREARARGYAAALVVTEHTSAKASVLNDGTRTIPCPQQTRDITCEQCKLCMRDTTLRAQDSAITFAAHGSGKKKVSLTVLKG